MHQYESVDTYLFIYLPTQVLDIWFRMKHIFGQCKVRIVLRVHVPLN